MELWAFLKEMPLYFQIPLGVVVAYALGALLFILTARLEKTPDGKLSIDHKSVYFYVAKVLFMQDKGTDGYREALEKAKARKIGVCGLYFEFVMGLALLFLIGVSFVLGAFVTLVTNIFSIPIFGYLAKLNTTPKEAEGPFIFHPLPLVPRIRGTRIWPIAYIALIACIYYWDIVSETTARFVMDPIFIQLLVWVSMVLAAIVIAAVVINFFRKSNQTLLIREWAVARYKQACPEVEVR